MAIRIWRNPGADLGPLMGRLEPGDLKMNMKTFCTCSAELAKVLRMAKRVNCVQPPDFAHRFVRQV